MRRFTQSILRYTQAALSNLQVGGVGKLETVELNMPHISQMRQKFADKRQKPS